MLADYHVHTPYCGHARGKIIEYVQAGIDAGLQEIGFSDHLGRYYLSATQRRRYWDWGMDRRNLARYVAELLDLREVYREKIRIRIGLEIDFIEGAEDILEPIIGDYPFDFLLASIHCLPRLGWRHLADYSSSADSTSIYKEYFRLARLALRTPIFNGIAHLDFIWRHIPWPKENPGMPIAELASTIRTAASMHRIVEINVNGYLWSLKNASAGDDPFELLLEQVQKLGVPISLGSDAHEPAQVAKRFPEVIGLLHRRGLRTFTCFADGKPRTEVLG